MPQTPELDHLTDEVLADLYHPGSYARGVTYAHEGRVRLLGRRPGALKAVVRGSGRQSYLVRVSWFGDGYGTTVEDECSCPLGGGCKHCVATLLVAREASAPAPPAPSESSDWRERLARLAAELEDPAAGGAPLALEVALVRPYRSRFGSPVEPHLRARPLRRGASGRWIKTGVSWRDLVSPYRLADGELDDAQRRVLTTMAFASGNRAYLDRDRALVLSGFGPDLWFHLRRAVQAGVALVGVREGPRSVELAGEPARVAVDLTGDPDGSVRLAATLVVDAEPVSLDDAHVGLLGTPAHGLFQASGDLLRLVPLTEPLNADLADLIVGGPLAIPHEDVEELLDDYQPALARYASLGSSDGSVPLLVAELDGLVVNVERTGLDTAVLRWAVRYRRGERLRTHPLFGADGAERGRDRAAERRLLAAVELPTHLLPGLVDARGLPRDAWLAGAEAVVLFSEVLPWLTGRGQVTVEVAEPSAELPELREAATDPLISLGVVDAADEGRDGTDWFDLHVEVSVDGEEVPFAELFAALSEDRELLVLPSGTWVRLDRPELAKLKTLIDEARGLVDTERAEDLRINRYQVAFWDELAALGVVARQSERWAASVARLRELREPEPVAPPSGLEATLRPYQREGLDWLAFLHANGLGGILADDMGLGKTVQALALCLHVHAADPAARFLVVAPTSVVENWRAEAERFAPGLTVRTLRETASRRGTELSCELAEATLVVTSYALFRLEFDGYAAQRFQLAFFDEAQYVKNHQGKTYQCVRRLDAATKVAMTGTPLENSLMDLWSLLSITAPGLYPDPARFATVYRKPIERGEAPELLATLRRRIAPLLRRRTKAAVLTDLPPKTEQSVEVSLSARHARLYQTQLQRERQKVLGLVGDLQRNRFEIFRSLTLLRQLSLDPALVDPAHEAVGSAKLDRLLVDLGEVVAEGHRALVFSQFTRFLARVRTRLDAAGLAHAYLDGRTRKRAEAIARFKDGEVPVFVISLKAGGVGLNLTEADYCFVLDPWWNPAVETQAVDRAHRIGQLNPVMVYRYVSAGTIEEKVMELKARKAALFADVMDADGALAGALTAADIRGLLDL